jgi:AraC family transcriptional activator of pobA
LRSRKHSKIDDKICPSEFLTSVRQVLKTIWNHIKGSFFYYYSGIGNIKVHVEDQVYVLKSGKYLLYFLIKSTFVKYEYWFEGKIILFEEVLFCSDILKTSLVLTTLTYLPTSIAPPFLALNLKRCFLL